MCRSIFVHTFLHELSLRVVGIFKTYQSTLYKQINIIITFSTEDMPPPLPVINNGTCILSYLTHIWQVEFQIIKKSFIDITCRQ